jgi:protein SCO1/2
MRKDLVWVGLGLLLGLAAVVVFALTRPYQFRGSRLEPAVAAPDFTLPSQQGDFTLSAQTGSIVMMFFGYTTCPDVCPATLSSLKEVTRRLGKDASKVKVVFITVDPKRDPVERIGQYVSNFSPSFIGLSGSEAQLDPVWKEYGVYRSLGEQSDAALDYLVEHSSYIYVVDKAGRLRLTYSFGTPTDDILSDVRYLLKE